MLGFPKETGLMPRIICTSNNHSLLYQWAQNIENIDNKNTSYNLKRDKTPLHYIDHLSGDQGVWMNRFNRLSQHILIVFIFPAECKLLALTDTLLSPQPPFPPTRQSQNNRPSHHCCQHHFACHLRPTFLNQRAVIESFIKHWVGFWP